MFNKLVSCLFCTTVWHTATSESPPNYPSHIPLRIGDYENWSNQLSVSNLWFATPSNAIDVVTLSNWAYRNNFTLRASGYMHTWSPLTVTQSNKIVKNVVLVDTTKTLINMKLTPSPYPNTKAVRVGSGTSMHNLLTFLEDNVLGLYSAPAVGDITIGGVLAIGGHSGDQITLKRRNVTIKRQQCYSIERYEYYF